MARGAKGGKGCGLVGRPGKNLTKEAILRAMRVTKSNKGAARFMNVSYSTYKVYSRLYVDEATGKTLYQLHLNRAGKGIPKFWKKEKSGLPMKEILDGTADTFYYDPHEIKFKLIGEGYLREECYKCGFKERRILDFRIPIILNFKDSNKNNYKLENLEFLCHNCYFLNVGDVHSEQTIKKLEGKQSHISVDEIKEFELDDYQREQLEKLGLFGNIPPPKDENDGSELISRI